MTTRIELWYSGRKLREFDAYNVPRKTEVLFDEVAGKNYVVNEVCWNMEEVGGISLRTAQLEVEEY